VAGLALRPGATPAPAGARRPRRVVPVAAALSLGAAWVHLAYTSPHWRDWWAYGLCFLAIGVGQGLFAAVLVRRPTTPVLLAGIAGNLGVVLMYVLSRTRGVPVGPHAGVVERAGTIDLATTAGEIVLVALLLALLGAAARRRIANAMLLAGAALWTLRLTGTLP
jgi:hypothetical protein